MAASIGRLALLVEQRLDGLLLIGLGRLTKEALQLAAETLRLVNRIGAEIGVILSL